MKIFQSKVMLYLSCFVVVLLLGSCSEPVSKEHQRAAKKDGSMRGRGDGSGGGRQRKRKWNKEGKGVVVTIFAASSTKNAIDQTIELFKRSKPATFNINYASSGQLASQLNQGAVADLFISANTQWVDRLDKELIVAQRRGLLSNSLVIAVPKGNPALVSGPRILTTDAIKHIAIAEPLSVPAGIYAREALTTLGYWEQIKPKIVSGANVRTTLAFIERGEVDAGIVYASDAEVSEKVQATYTFEESSHTPIDYPIVLLKHAENNGIAKQLFDFFGSYIAHAAFNKYGFKYKKPEVPFPLKKEAMEKAVG